MSPAIQRDDFHAARHVAQLVRVPLYPRQIRHLVMERQANGDLALSGFALLQSDVTTLLTLFLVLLRGSAAAWSAATVWRYAFLTMEKSGLGVHEIAHTLTYALPARFTSHHAGGEGHGTVLLVAFVLVAINASTKVCTKAEAKRLAGSLK